MYQNLTRVQLYLEPENLELVDKMTRQIRANRSQIIRDLVSAVAKRYVDTVVFLGVQPRKRNPLLDLVAAGKSKTGTVGLNVDEIYLHD